MTASLLYAVLTLAFGALALWGARRVSRDIRNARDWPTVAGWILERGVGESITAGNRSYLAHVQYQYTVDGADYDNDQVYLIRRTGHRSDVVQRLVDGLPNPVPVHYDPAAPASSYLIVNSLSTYWVLLIFGIGALLLGLLQLLTALI